MEASWGVAVHSSENSQYSLVIKLSLPEVGAWLFFFARSTVVVRSVVATFFVF